MKYSIFKDKKISRLGFGMMRLPQKVDKTIDETETERLIDYAFSHGINYFDTAYPYHGGMSEVVAGNILKKYPRESFYLASKYPGHQIAETYNPKEIFENQLKKCQVDYFDFYLLHNVTESSIDVYLDPKWGIIDYFLEQKKLGKIKHLGFSSHAKPDCLKRFLEAAADKMEFCQIQLNYLDWTLQDAKAKCDMLNSYNIPIWVMEPVRGGKLADLNDDAIALLSKYGSSSCASWAFKWVDNIPGVSVVLSGMTTMDQLADNCKTFSEDTLLTKQESETLLSIAESMKHSVPCTECRYCCDGCPMGLDIPYLLHIYNELQFSKSGFTPVMQYESLPENKLASACIGCGACMQICPQKIEIPSALEKLSLMIKEVPSWKEICKQRAEEAKKIK